MAAWLIILLVIAAVFSIERAIDSLKRANERQAQAIIEELRSIRLALRDNATGKPHLDTIGTMIGNEFDRRRDT